MLIELKEMRAAGFQPFTDLIRTRKCLKMKLPTDNPDMNVEAVF